MRQFKHPPNDFNGPNGFIISILSHGLSHDLGHVLFNLL